MMRLLGKAYDALIYGMAIVAAALLLAMMVIIFADVVLRNLEYQSSAHFFTFTEYGLLVIPCLGAPWLVRERGHIYVEILMMYLKPAGRRRLVFLVTLACIAVCLTLAWAGLQVTLRNYWQGEIDVRSMDMPRWMVVGFVPLSFLLMAIEFARFLVRGENPLAPLAAEEPAKDHA
jgi:C4-dicarboxylate transporter, DctQ subunit